MTSGTHLSCSSVVLSVRLYNLPGAEDHQLHQLHGDLKTFREQVTPLLLHFIKGTVRYTNILTIRTRVLGPDTEEVVTPDGYPH